MRTRIHGQWAMAHWIDADLLIAQFRIFLQQRALYHQHIHASQYPRSEAFASPRTPQMDILRADSAILRVWVLITGLAGLGAAIGAYLKPLSPHKTLYTRIPDTANASFARMYGTWLLTSTIIRIAFFLSSPEYPSVVFFLAFGTYVIAAFHFVTEIFVFRSAGLRPGGVAPLIVAGGSIIWFSAILLR